MIHYLFMLAAAVLLGTIGVFIKLIGTNLHFMAMIFLRVFFAFLFLLLVVPLIDKNVFKKPLQKARPRFIIGALFALSFAFVNTAIVFAPIQNAVLINATYPFLVLILAFFLLKEKITHAKKIALGLAFLGLAIINPFKTGSYLTGNLLALASTVFNAFLIIQMRREKLRGIGDVMWFFFFASLLLFPFALYFGFQGLETVLPFVLGLGIISTGLAYMLFYTGFEKVDAGTGSAIEMIVSPVVSILLAVIIISEPLNPTILFGGAILIAAGASLKFIKR